MIAGRETLNMGLYEPDQAVLRKEDEALRDLFGRPAFYHTEPHHLCFCQKPTPKLFNNFQQLVLAVNPNPYRYHPEGYPPYPKRDSQVNVRGRSPEDNAEGGDGQGSGTSSRSSSRSSSPSRSRSRNNSLTNSDSNYQNSIPAFFRPFHSTVFPDFGPSQNNDMPKPKPIPPAPTSSAAAPDNLKNDRNRPTWASLIPDYAAKSHQLPNSYVPEQYKKAHSSHSHPPTVPDNATNTRPIQASTVPAKSSKGRPNPNQANLSPTASSSNSRQPHASWMLENSGKIRPNSAPGPGIQNQADDSRKIRQNHCPPFPDNSRNARPQTWGPNQNHVAPFPENSRNGRPNAWLPNQNHATPFPDNSSRAHPKHDAQNQTKGPPFPNHANKAGPNHGPWGPRQDSAYPTYSSKRRPGSGNHQNQNQAPASIPTKPRPSTSLPAQPSKSARPNSSKAPKQKNARRPNTAPDQAPTSTSKPAAEDSALPERKPEVSPENLSDLERIKLLRVKRDEEREDLLGIQSEPYFDSQYCYTAEDEAKIDSKADSPKEKEAVVRGPSPAPRPGPLLFQPKEPGISSVYAKQELNPNAAGFPVQGREPSPPLSDWAKALLPESCPKPELTKEQINLAKMMRRKRDEEREDLLGIQSAPYVDNEYDYLYDI